MPGTLAYIILSGGYSMPCLYRGVNQGPERLSNLLKVTPLGIGAGICSKPMLNL